MANERSPQDSIGLLNSGNGSSASIKFPSPGPTDCVESTEQLVHLDQLQSRLEVLEYENARLRSVADTLHTIELEGSTQTGVSQVEQGEATMSRISLLERQLHVANLSLQERDSKIVALNQTAEEYRGNLENQTRECETRLKEAEFRLRDSAVLVKSLQVAIEIKDGVETENKAVLKAQGAELMLLQARLEKSFTKMEDEKRDLGMQIDELRQAGQV